MRRLEDGMAALQQQAGTAIQTADSFAQSGEEQSGTLGELLKAGQDFLLNSTVGQGGTPVNNPPPSAAVVSQRWLPFEVLAELRCIFRMYFDPRYFLTWQTRLLPPLVLLAMFLNWWMVGAIPLIGGVLERVLFLVLAYVLFKVLMREATRYRLTSPDLPSTLRL